MSDEASFGDHLTTDQTAVLLQVSLSEAARPIDVLTERLSEPDGEAWLGSALHAVLSEIDIAILHGAPGSETEIAAVKSRAKRRLAEAADHQEHLAALACYCLSVAQGLVLTKRLMSSRSGAEWAELLADLAGVVPIQWRETMITAAELALQHGQ